MGILTLWQMDPNSHWQNGPAPLEDLVPVVIQLLGSFFHSSNSVIIKVVPILCLRSETSRDLNLLHTFPIIWLGVETQLLSMWVYHIVSISGTGGICSWYYITYRDQFSILQTQIELLGLLRFNSMQWDLYESQTISGPSVIIYETKSENGLNRHCQTSRTISRMKQM